MSVATVSASRKFRFFDGSPNSMLLAELRPVIRFLMYRRAQFGLGDLELAEIKPLLETWRFAMMVVQADDAASLSMGHKDLGKCLLVISHFRRAFGQEADESVRPKLARTLGRMYGVLDGIHKKRPVQPDEELFVFEALQALASSIDY